MKTLDLIQILTKRFNKRIAGQLIGYTKESINAMIKEGALTDRQEKRVMENFKDFLGEMIGYIEEIEKR